MSRPGAMVGVDVGGTFTDLFLLDAAGRFRTAKVPSRRGDEAQGFLGGLRALPEEERIAARKVTIMADKELPFKLVRTVMATSTAAGYGSLSLAVMQKASDLTLASVASNN